MATTTIEHGALQVINEAPFCAETPAEQLRQPITPSASHFVRSNFVVPALGDDHTIVFDGAVAMPRRVSVEMLRALARREVVCTLECAGNSRTSMRPVPAGEPWRDGAVSTAEWAGAPLRDVLAESRPSRDVCEIVIEGADRGVKTDAHGPITFARSLSIEDIHADVLLAYEMNGEPISASHGGPVRLIVPGWYGMASVKWVARISARTTPFDGYFQKQRYVYVYERETVPVTRMRVKSLIVEPADGAVVSGQEVDVRGWAWSGEGAIAAVDVSVGSDERWTRADLEPPASPFAWTRWRCRVRVDRSGPVSIRSRATDARGNVQPETAAWNELGYGNNAIRSVTVTPR